MWFIIVLVLLLIATPPYSINGDASTNILFRMVLILMVVVMDFLTRRDTSINSEPLPKRRSAPAKVQPVEEPKKSLFTVDVHSIFKTFTQKLDSESKVKRWASAIKDLYEGSRVYLNIEAINRQPSFNTIQFSIKTETNVIAQKERKSTPNIKKIQGLLPDVERVVGGKPNVMFQPIVEGKPWIGYVIPSDVDNVTGLGNAFSESSYLKHLDQRNKHGQLLSLPVPVGYSSFGDLVTIDLANAKTPHALVAGMTGSGKSTAISTYVCALAAAHTPQTLQFDMVDVKTTEFPIFEDIAHLSQHQVVYDSNDVDNLLEFYIAEMAERYERIKRRGKTIRNIYDYNRLCRKPEDFMPYRVLIIDEMADALMSMDNRVDSESKLVRLAQAGRAAGLSLILSTQRPDATILPPLLTTNIPCRIAFRVVKAVDSNIILGDSKQAMNLNGDGDGIVKIGDGQNVRFQGIMVSNHEISKLVRATKNV